MYTSATAMSILLVRHGETASNAARILQTPDIPLSERGLAQAERLGARLAQLGAEAIVSSDYARARMTAERVQAATGAPLELWPELRERNFGELRGRAYAELGLDPFAAEYVPPGGESWDEFHRRTAGAWRRVLGRARELRGNLVVVSHGLVCRAFAEREIGLGGMEAPLAWPNTSLTIIASEAPPSLELLNCVEHLSGLESAPAGALGRA
ncbi:MAG TPA: histidine phosphatase family protein [Myxococcota bacterium]|nr:histidine phosphatase family protein [Myxococcota bacterium]